MSPTRPARRRRPKGCAGRLAPVLLPLLLPIGSLNAQTPDSTLVDPEATDSVRAILRERLPVYTVTSADLESELGSQDISGILQSSRDIFAATAGLTFGQARFRIRGLDGENLTVLIDGIPVNDPEAGWATWSLWGGLNDVTRYQETRVGNQPSRLIFAGIGGYSAISTRASEQRRGTRVSYASSDRAYRHRIMATHSTGQLANGWSFSGSLSRRWANEGYAEGTYFDAFSYFFAAEKRINASHSIAFTAFGASLEQGRQGLAVQEAYDLTGTNYYNPFWGYQNGVKRNARVSNDHKPMFILSHRGRLTERTKLTTALYYTFGKDGMTGLNWYDARDPRPDYYRYLPSFWTETDPTRAISLAEAWRNDPNTSQINWDQLYFANGKNLYSVENANGIAGNTITGNRSKYIVEDMRSDPRRMGINSVLTTALDDRSDLTIGAGFHDHVTHNYKVMSDLLGGDFWVDVDQFAEQDFEDPNAAQNDLTVTNRVVTQGDRFGYDYDLHVRSLLGFVQYERRWQQVEVYVAGNVGHNSFWRDGNMVNGRFPDDSFGKGKEHSFLHYGVKGGAVYKLSGRHFITANGAWLTRPPLARTAYLSPRVRDAAVSEMDVEKVLSGDLNYILRFPRLRGRATVYYASIQDQLWLRSFYHDEFRTLVNYSMRDVDQTHLGTEIGVEAQVTSTFSVSAVYGGGRFLYDSRPLATITRDNSTEVFDADRVVYWRNYRVGGMPQSAASLGLRYNSPKFWFVSLNANWFDHIYLDPNPDRRTQQALGNFVTDDPQWDRLLAQERVDGAFTLDLFGGKSWMFKRKYRVAINVSVSNLLDNQDLIMGGFEQLRYERSDVDRFPPKYSYLFGRTYFAMLSIGF